MILLVYIIMRGELHLRLNLHFKQTPPLTQRPVAPLLPEQSPRCACLTLSCELLRFWTVFLALVRPLAIRSALASGNCC